MVFQIGYPAPSLCIMQYTNEMNVYSLHRSTSSGPLKFANNSSSVICYVNKGPCVWWQQYERHKMFEVLV